MCSMILIYAVGESKYRVTVEEGEARTIYEITASLRDVNRYAPGATPEELVRASFKFLLNREPKETIRPSFDLPTIERHFPEYLQKIRELL